VFSNREVGFHLIDRLGLTTVRYAGRQRRLKYYIGFSQSYTDKDVVDRFNQTLLALYQRGVAQAILKKYQMEPVDPQ